MADALPKIDRELLSVIARGAEKTFDNAERLYFEAELLAKVGATARALCLHQISLEECSKIESMGAWATALVSGIDVDQKGVLNALRQHASKNKTNAYMMEGSQAEKDAKANADWEAMHDEFKKFQKAFHETSNDAKNASLYVDWMEGEFVSPSERITQEMLAEIVTRNQMFLGFAQNGLKMLQRLDKSPADLQDLLVQFMDATKQKRVEMPDDPVAAGSELVQAFLDAGLKRLREKRE
jgi:AbiV family abortive infection protein